MNVSALPKKILHAVAVSVSLSLILLGMRVPNVSPLHPSKPRPRAIIETAAKNGLEAGTKANVPVDACRNTLVLGMTETFRAFLRLANTTTCRVPLELRAARAPPAITA